MSQILISRSTEGTAVAEVDLDATTLPVGEIVEQARKHGAEVVWAYGGDPASEGFLPQPGYAHLRADDPVAGDALPAVDPDVYGPLLVEAYLGQWGHKWVDPSRPLPNGGSVVLCLHEEGVPVGLCRVWPEQRLVDQPGVVRERRGAASSVSLLGAACALLGPGPVEVDTWGEDPEVLEAWGRLGFVITEEQRGWEVWL